MSVQLTKELFTECLNTTFRLRLAGAADINLVLTEVSVGQETARQEQFALLFQGPNEFILRQGIYSFTHDAIGDFELFIVPVGQDSNGVAYEAVFNRLRPKEA